MSLEEGPSSSIDYVKIEESEANIFINECSDSMDDYLINIKHELGNRLDIETEDFLSKEDDILTDDKVLTSCNIASSHHTKIDTMEILSTTPEIENRLTIIEREIIKSLEEHNLRKKLLQLDEDELDLEMKLCKPSETFISLNFKDLEEINLNEIITSDALIIKYGNHVLSLDKSTSKEIVIELQEALAMLIMEAQKIYSVKDYYFFMNINNYSIFCDGIKAVCEYNAENNTFKNKLLLWRIIKGTLSCTNFSEMQSGDLVELENIQFLQYLLQTDWGANAYLLDKNDDVIITEDDYAILYKGTDLLLDELNILIKILKQHFCPMIYNKLVKITCAAIIALNKTNSQYVENIKICNYEKLVDAVDSKQQKMFKIFADIELLLTEDIVSAIKLILTNRELLKIGADNPFIFATNNLILSGNFIVLYYSQLINESYQENEKQSIENENSCDIKINRLISNLTNDASDTEYNYSKDEISAITEYFKDFIDKKIKPERQDIIKCIKSVPLLSNRKIECIQDFIKENFHLKINMTIKKPIFSSKEKKAIFTYFKKHIEYTKMPHIKEIKKMIEEDSIFTDKSPSSIRNFFRNYYKKLKYNSDSDETETTTRGSVYTREERDAIFRYFPEYIQSGIVPDIDSINKCIDNSPELWRRDMKSVREFIRNHYKRIKRNAAIEINRDLEFPSIRGANYTIKEKEAILKHFQSFIDDKTMPTIEQMQACVKNEPDLCRRSISSIKEFIKNHYKRMDSLRPRQHKRINYSQSEKDIIHAYFKDNIKIRKTPTIDEVRKFLMQEPELGRRNVQSIHQYLKNLHKRISIESASKDDFLNSKINIIFEPMEYGNSKEINEDNEDDSSMKDQAVLIVYEIEN